MARDIDRLKERQNDHLLLLVGRNPLPNAVAGSLLAAPDGHVTLIHSPETFKVAKVLGDWLGKQGIDSNRIRFQEVKENESASIFRGIKEAFGAVPHAESIGVNYTGGTKAMAVHAYRAVERLVKEKGITCEYSYLDARTLSLIFDSPDIEGGPTRPPVYLGSYIEIKFEDMLGMHGWKLLGSRPSPILLRTAEELINLNLGDGEEVRRWVAWKRDELNKYRRGSRWLGDESLGNLILSLPPERELQGIVQVLLTELELEPGTTQIRIGKAAAAAGCTPQDFCAWLDGCWLESYALQSLIDCYANRILYDVRMNITPLSSGNLRTHFELDVVAVRGYQLFAFSCSTDPGRGILKRKLFEAYFRARQLGGDEARIALICTSGAAEELEAEVQGLLDMDSPSGEKRHPELKPVRVFGLNHLKGLSTHISNWIEYQSGESR